MPRKPQFYTEIFLLVNMIDLHKHVLFSKLKNSITLNVRQSLTKWILWECSVEEVEGVPGGVDICSLHTSQTPVTSGPSTPLPPPLRLGRHSLRAAASPGFQESTQSGSSPNSNHPAASPQGPPCTRSHCSEDLLRGIREELATLREQKERQLQEMMAYQKENFALMAQQVSLGSPLKGPAIWNL